MFVAQRTLLSQGGTQSDAYVQNTDERRISIYHARVFEFLAIPSWEGRAKQAFIFLYNIEALSFFAFKK